MPAPLRKLQRGTGGVAGDELTDLLSKIEAREVDIVEVSISDIASRILDRAFPPGGQGQGQGSGSEIDIDSLSEVLVKLSELVQLKVRKILPPDPPAALDDAASIGLFQDGLEQDADPGGEDDRSGSGELLARLMQYRVFRDAAVELERREELWRNVYTRTDLAGPCLAPAENRGVNPGGPGAADAGEGVLNKDVLRQLLDELREVLDADPEEALRHIPLEEMPIVDKMEEVMAQVEKKGVTTFRDLFSPRSTRVEIIATFLAILELIRLMKLTVSQEGRFGKIVISKA
ncbi:MAG: hypothetical protein HPY71_02165 [Firmicutes bacterium]|nr:hypothetical protein [Bacillota bacterium]